MKPWQSAPQLRCEVRRSDKKKPVSCSVCSSTGTAATSRVRGTSGNRELCGNCPTTAAGSCDWVVGKPSSSFLLEIPRTIQYHLINSFST